MKIRFSRQKTAFIGIVGLLLWSLAAGATPVQNKLVPGKNGGAAHFDGLGDSLVIPGSETLDLSGSFSLTVWVKPDRWMHESTMIHHGTLSLVKRGYTSGSIYCWAQLGGKKLSLVWAPEEFPLPLGEWNHIAVTYDAEQALAIGYYNGEEVTRMALAESNPELTTHRITPGHVPLQFGDGLMPYEGALDGIYLYDRPLTPEEVKATMTEQGPDGALAVYLFNDTPGKPPTDSSGHGRSGKWLPGVHELDLDELGQSCRTEALYQDETLTVWPKHALDKAMKGDRPAVTGIRNPENPLLQLARNETESFQILLTPERQLDNVTLTVSDLSGPAGASLPAAAITINRVEYIPVNEISRTSTDGTAVKGEAAVAFDVNTARPGYYPDPLLPQKAPLTLQPGRSYAFFLTAKTTDTTAAGIYRGTLQLVTATETRHIPFCIEVWDFALPQEFHTTNTAYFSPWRTTMDEDVVYRFFAERHLANTPLRGEVKATIAGDGKVRIDTADFDRSAQLAIEKYGMKMLQLPLMGIYQMPKAVNAVRTRWCGVEISSEHGQLTEEFKQAFGDYLEQISAHLREKGYLELTRVTLVDEPWTWQDFTLSEQLSALIRQRAPELKIMVTKWPKEQLYGKVDIWSLGFFQPDEMTRALARGETLEWYPNWHVIIDRPLMDARMLGWAMWKYHLSGLFLWHTANGWDKAAKIYQVPRSVYSDGRLIWGLGLLVYPDENFNPCSSLRLEAVRDTLEDYEYLYLLEQASAGTAGQPETRQRARELLTGAVEAIVPYYEAEAKEEKWKQLQWETDWRKLAEFRQQIAVMILALQSEQ